MRAVIDTNVVVSGLINPHGAPGRVIDAVLAGVIIPLYDDRILGEYRDVLRRKRFGFDVAVVDAFLDYVECFGEPVIATGAGVTLPDPDDLPFLEVAIAGHADAVITGNGRHFVPLAGHHQVRICAPAEVASR